MARDVTPVLKPGVARMPSIREKQQPLLDNRERERQTDRGLSVCACVRACVCVRVCAHAAGCILSSAAGVAAGRVRVKGCASWSLSWLQYLADSFW